MKTAFYVYSSNAVTIATSEDALVLDRIDGDHATLAHTNSLTLGAGIYAVISDNPLSITYTPSTSIEIVTGNNKDVLPKPKPQLQTIPAGSSATTFDQAFGDFMTAKALASI
jgi:hypothetical protein